MRGRALGLLAVGSLGALFAGCGSSSAPPSPPPSPDDFVANVNDPRSCVLDCAPACVEGPKPWKCPALAEYATLPHDPQACGAFDGKTWPAVVHGACAASAPSGDALAQTSLTASPVILPDGRRLAPAGTEWRFLEPDMPGGFPSYSLLIPGTSWLVVEDTGYDMHSIRVVDTQALLAGQPPVVSSAKFPQPHALNWGLAYVNDTSTLYVASGVPDSKVYAFDFDTQSGAITEDSAKTVSLGSGVFPEGIAISGDGKTLLVGQAANSNGVLVVSLDAATYGMVAGQIDVGRPDVFAVHFDPNDPTGNTAYASMWRGELSPTNTAQMYLMQLDVAGMKATGIVVDKAPEDMAFLSSRYMVQANALGDTLSVVDIPAQMAVADVPLGANPGTEPTTLTFDAPNHRLYATLASANGIAAFDVDLAQTPPALTALGTLPTAWWPTSVTVDSAGALYVTNGKGHGMGTDDLHRGLNMGFPSSLLSGSVQAIPYMDDAAVAAADTQWQAMNQVGKIAGYPEVDCGGAPYDFPIPAATTDGASAKISHVFFIVRENKTFDDIMGDLPNVNGDPNLVMAPGQMDNIWPNARSIAQTFAHMDNFYEDAEQSIQGHTWTVFGRSTDYDERRWLIIWGRGELGATASPGVGDDTAPKEGSVFTNLIANGVTVENMGELIGGLGDFRDIHWPGGGTGATVPDTLGSCYVAARARSLCNMKQFTYAWLTNDHGFGLAAGYPNPAIMVAVNDEATGMFLDGISHSSIWPESLVVIVEDDPQDGSDHVDQHRSIALFASPWVKRGYVSHGHYDMASIHKLFAHVFGTPYKNGILANAPLPLDVFTATPDYTPYTYIPRRYADNSCNPSGTTGAMAAEGWDFSEPDNQPGLGEQNAEYLRGVSTVAGK